MKAWDVQACEQALSDERVAGRNAHVVAAAAHAYCEEHEKLNTEGIGGITRVNSTHDALLAACDATTPSPTRTHTVVAVSELERLRKVDRYLQEYLGGYLDMGDLEDVREARGGARGRVADPLAECADHSEAPEHDGGGS